MFPQLGAHNWEIRCTQFVIKKLAIGNQMQGQPWNGELLEHCILHDHLYIHTRQRTFWKKNATGVGLHQTAFCNTNIIHVRKQKAHHTTPQSRPISIASWCTVKLPWLSHIKTIIQADFSKLHLRRLHAIWIFRRPLNLLSGYAGSVSSPLFFIGPVLGCWL